MTSNGSSTLTTCARKEIVGSILLKRLRHSGLRTDELLKYYLTYIRPIMEYACQAFHGSLTGGQISQIESVQRRSLRIIYPGLDYKDALSTAGLEQLEHRRKNLCKWLFHQISNVAHILNYLIPDIKQFNYPLRNPTRVLTNWRTSFMHYCVEKFNS